MSFAAIAECALGVVYATFGKAAAYTPPAGGDAVACTVIRDREDKEMGFGSGAAMMQSDTIEVRKSEIASPARGGTFVVGGETLKVRDDPRCTDPDRLVWTMTVAKVA